MVFTWNTKQTFSWADVIIIHVCKKKLVGLQNAMKSISLYLLNCIRYVFDVESNHSRYWTRIDGRVFFVMFAKRFYRVTVVKITWFGLLGVSGTLELFNYLDTVITRAIESVCYRSIILFQFDFSISSVRIIMSSK